MLKRLGFAAIAFLAVAFGACAETETGSSPEPTTFVTALRSTPVVRSEPSEEALGDPPFENLERLVELADLGVIVRIEDVGPLTETIGKSGVAVWHQDATAVVERVIFGPWIEKLTVRNVLYSGPDLDHRHPTKAPSFQPGERTLLFLTSHSNFFDLRGTTFETVGGGVLWGKFAATDESVFGLSPATEPRPIEPVTSWIREARDSLALPGILSGTVTGLDNGDEVTIELLGSGATDDELVEVVHSWTQGNGTWEKEGLRLRSGSYAIKAGAPGYLPLTSLYWFQVPDEGIYWRHPGIDIEMFHPGDALERFGTPLCDPPQSSTLVPSGSISPTNPLTVIPTPPPLAPPLPGAPVCFAGHLGKAFRVTGGLRGQIGLPIGATATVRIQRLAQDPAMQYYGGPKSDKPYPTELVTIDASQPPTPIEPFAALHVKDGRWGLVDPSLAGHPYLVTLQVDGPGRYVVEPPGYQVVILGGKVPHQVRGIDLGAALLKVRQAARGITPSA